MRGAGSVQQDTRRTGGDTPNVAFSRSETRGRGAHSPRRTTLLDPRAACQRGYDVMLIHK
jgi:hypothetical protein